MSLMMAVNS